ncbi:MAG: gamma carbonic anhydrase family protein [Ignavibacteriae bacterium]|nr:gamma carbonic anhydrase family protein [Ignavibacteriota bacterium]
MKFDLKLEEKLYQYLDLFPKLGENVFLADGVKIIGDVTIGKNSSVWYNCVIRGDVHYVKIGEDTNIQDLSMLHVTNKRFPLNIGNKVTIGHSVKLHGCTLQDLSFIGIGAIVLDGAIVEEKSMVAAGSVVKPNFIVPSGKLVGGVPAKILRDLTQNEIDDFEASAERYKKYSQITIESLLKRVKI